MHVAISVLVRLGVHVNMPGDHGVSGGHIIVRMHEPPEGSSTSVLDTKNQWGLFKDWAECIALGGLCSCMCGCLCRSMGCAGSILHHIAM